MKELSPAARSVFESFNSRFDWVEDGVPGPQFKAIAAALRAAADQVVPDAITWQSPSEQARHWSSAEYRAGEQDMAFVVRRKLLLIADKLEAL